MIHVTDDRDQSVPARRLVPRTILGLLAPGVLSAIFRRARQAGYAKAVGMAVFGALMLCAGAGIPLAAITAAFWHRPPLSLPLAACSVVALLTLALAYVRIYFHRLQTWNPPRIARAIVAEGRCASCEYPIVGLSPEADGCVVCPECGAAWKLNTCRI